MNKKRILVISSCTGEKKFKLPEALTLNDFNQGGDYLAERIKNLADKALPAEEMYTGLQHQRLMRGIEALRKSDNNLTVDLYILSAGFGLIASDCKVVPYECTFQGMKTKELDQWALHLDIPQNIRKLVNETYDLGLILLGDDYLRACALDSTINLGGPTILMCGKNQAQRIPDLHGLQKIVLGNAEAKRFACGLVGLKGEIARRILIDLSAIPDKLYSYISNSTKLLDLLDGTLLTNEEKQGNYMSFATIIDRIIQIPASWWDKPHRQQLRYFIPEWDDLVDPNYDFLTDTHSRGKSGWANEVYAHQLYSEPNYDGLLISKVVAEKTKKKAELINLIGVHRYLRVPREFPVMGDCGAFGYIMKDVPPYTTEEILDYYTRLDFDYGVSIDHLIVNATEASKKFRYELTINNAEEFIKEHRKRGLAWEPVGAVQGWDPESYTKAASQYVKMGYRYIALGGLVRTQTPQIIQILNSVHQVVPDNVAIHLFGIGRLQPLKQFESLGVRSVDSASLLRRAWMGTGQNYLTEKGELYAAIRIPETGKSFRAKRMVLEGRISAEKAKKLEHEAMMNMLAYDEDKCSLDTVLNALMELDQHITPDRPDNSHLLRCTLEDKPWKACNCDICRRDGIQVIIFRGNDRNRRRGFHNTYTFYRLFQQALTGAEITLRRPSSVLKNQEQNILQGALYGEPGEELECVMI